MCNMICNKSNLPNFKGGFKSYFANIVITKYSKLLSKYIKFYCKKAYEFFKFNEKIKVKS